MYARVCETHIGKKARETRTKKKLEFRRDTAHENSLRRGDTMAKFQRIITCKIIDFYQTTIYLYNIRYS